MFSEAVMRAQEGPCLERYSGQRHKGEQTLARNDTNIAGRPAYMYLRHKYLEAFKVWSDDF